MEAKRVRRRGTPIPVPPPRIPTPMPPCATESAVHSNERCISKYANADPLGAQLNVREREEIEAMKMITPRMDRNGYFSYVASTAKKKKINLMQSKLPRMAFVYTPDGGKSSPQQENLSRDPPAPQSRVSRARTSVADGRALMTHRAVARAPRAPDPWSEKPQQCKSVDEHQKLQNRLPIYQQDQEDRYKNLRPTSCHRQPQPPELVYQSKSNNSQLECYSPKYHHIRPQPKGAPASPAAGYQNYPNSGRRDGQYVVNQSVVSSAKSGNKWSEDGGDSQNRHTPKLNGLYTESQFSYRVNGHPGNLAQASAAAAFFAR